MAPKKVPSMKNQFQNPSNPQFQFKKFFSRPKVEEKIMNL
jgi:hypothetical protein